MQQPDRPGFILTLSDGARVFLGPVLPEDAWRLREGLKGMGAESRYLRFFHGFAAFTDAQVRYFTQVDQVRHVAWGVLDVSQPGFPGVGIGRFAIDPHDPARAEWAIAIIDAWQRRGLGGVLLAILYLEAERRGVQMLTALVLPENRQVLDWFAQLGAHITPQPDALLIELPIARDSPTLASTAAGQHLLERIARIEPLLNQMAR